MNGFLRGKLLAVLSGITLALAGCGGGGGSGSNPPGAPAPTVVVQPLPLPGPYAVACSNVVQDFSRVGAGEVVTSYWEGNPWDNGMTRYATDLLADPGNTLIATMTAPNDSNLYGSFAGKKVEFVVLVCYPTTVDNPFDNYSLPTGKVVPHMQTGADAPLFADNSVRYPVVAFSHGYSGSPLSSDYISALSVFASYGYVVIAPFHGDLRFSVLKIEDLGAAIALLSDLSNFTALQALRPLSISAALDLVLAHPQWQGHIDNTRIGGFGASMGGETMMLLGGAGLTTSYFDLGLSWNQVTHDPRIKAAVGYVPYFGQPFLPAFGRDQHGLDGINLPFLGIGGTADTTAPISEVKSGMLNLTGTRELVALSGVEHGFDNVSTNDILTWTLMFLDSEVRGTLATRQQLSTMASVAGGGDDSVWIYYNGSP
jgi:predicted dienelactone hydrolase